jgi:hypothetical protein
MRERPSEIAQEFLFPCWANLPAGAAPDDFEVLADPIEITRSLPVIPALFRAIADSLIVFCPDMVSAIGPYLFVRVEVNQTPVPGWSNIPIFPRDGAASVSFDTSIDLEPQSQVVIRANNQDAVNTHFVGCYLHGWMWPRDYVDQ